MYQRKLLVQSLWSVSGIQQKKSVIICEICVQIFYLKQTGIISPFAKQYFSTSSGAILDV